METLERKNDYDAEISGRDLKAIIEKLLFKTQEEEPEEK